MFSFGERLGMFFLMMGGCLSVVSVSFILLLTVFRWLRRIVFPWSRSKHSLDVSDNIIFLNLMLANLIQAMGELPIIKWMTNEAITEGRLCTAQAVIKQAGGDGVALSSLAIAVHTFCVLVLRWSPPKYVSKLAVLMIWIFIALVIGIAYTIQRREHIYGNVGYWCWVRKEFKTEQLVTEYIWIWVSLCFMAILYAIMFFVMRGWLIVDNGVWCWYKNYAPSSGAGQPVEETQEEKDSKAIAKSLLLYPAVYVIGILPYSIARWRFYSGFKVPYQLTLSTATFFSLSGMVNSVLFFLTRPNLVIGAADAPPTPTVNTHMDSFHDKERISPSSRNFGSLPTHSPVASDYVLPDLERVSSPTLQLNMPLTEGAKTTTHASRWICDTPNYATRSVPECARVEEKTYGLIPVRLEGSPQHFCTSSCACRFPSVP